MSADIDSPAVEEAAPPPVVEEAAIEAPPEETVERDTESDTLEIPDSSAEGGKARYVPASALAGARKELKELKGELASAKEGSSRAQQLEQQIAQLQHQVNQLVPIAQAYQAAVQQQPQPTVVEDDTEAIELAQTLDLYTPEGKPDVAKAKKMVALLEKKAGQKAQEHVAPLQHSAVQSQSAFNLQRALNTELNGQKADPAILRQLWARVPAETTADPDSAKHLFIQALGLTAANGAAKKETPRTPSGQFTKAEDVPAPIYTEKAGGKDTAPAMPLNDFEKKMAKEMGLSEKEYLESANKAPWLRR